MRILFVFLSIIFSSTSIAYLNNYNCMHMIVTIKNNTPNTCYLLTEELVYGDIIPAHDIPFKISPNEESPTLDLVQSELTIGTSIELVYECGEGYYIRLYSQKNECGNLNKVNASILYTANLTATYQANPASYWSNKPASIKWTIE